jgi:hypothetical protein
LLLGAIVLGMNPSFASPLASEGRLIGGTWQDEQLGQELLSAAKRGYFKVVERLIAQGASVEAKDNHGWGPLSWAAYNDHEAMCRLLITKKASIEVKNNYGATPLMHAAQFGYEAVCKLLIANKASVEAKNNDGWTPLIWAAANGHETICRLLIANKASVEAKDNDGWTPLIYAANCGHESVCKLLIANKASIEVKSNDGWTPLMRAARCGHDVVCMLLIDVQLEEARKSKAAIATFLGVARKRSYHLPCHMQYDVAKLIARQAFESVQQDKQLVVEQINEVFSLEKRTRLLEHLNRQMNVRINALKLEETANKKINGLSGVGLKGVEGSTFHEQNN